MRVDEFPESYVGRATPARERVMILFEVVYAD